jgi:hypothetical protein
MVSAGLNMQTAPPLVKLTLKRKSQFNAMNIIGSCSFPNDVGRKAILFFPYT